MYACIQSIRRGQESDPTQVPTNMISDMKIGENFRRKAHFVAGGHTTETPTSLTYSSVVSCDLVQIALTIAALNNLKVMACNIQNAYLTAPCREKIWTCAGPNLGQRQVLLCFYTGNRCRCAQQVKYVGNTDVFCFGFYFMSPKWTRTKLVNEISMSLQAY